MDAIQLDDLLHYHFLSGLSYAPGGQCAAFVVSTPSQDAAAYDSCLWLYDGALRQLTAMGQEKSFVWEDQDHLLFPAVRSAEERKRKEQKESFTSYYRLHIHGGEALPALTLPFAASRLEVLDHGFAALGTIDVNTPDAYLWGEEERAEEAKRLKKEADYEVLDELPYRRNGSGMVNKTRTALFTVTPEGTCRRITDPLFSVESMVSREDTVYFTGKSYDARSPFFNGGIYRLEALSGTVTKILDVPDLDIGELALVDNALWYTANDAQRHGINQNGWVYALDLTTLEPTLLRKEEYHMNGRVGSDCRYGGGACWQVRDHSLYHITARDGSAPVYRLLPDGSSCPVLTKEGSVDVLALSEDNPKALLLAMYDQKLQELYEADLTTGEVRQLSHFNDAALADKYVAAPVPLTVESCGYDIGGWVLLPKDFDPQKTYPAVLDIHGGPKTAYGPLFYHEMQLWAGMGYFVFFCNPKGGDGRDSAFMDIRGDYGQTDYRNLMDFTDAVLRAYPQIDPAKLCVTGGSYGGFMTNWIIGHTDRFCCAASQRSISNWLSFFGTSDIGYYFSVDQTGADFYTQPERMWEQSPIRYADKVKTPTLFIHSDQDYRCPLEQGLQMFTALRDRGIPARLCMFHGENHELSRSGVPEHRLRRLREITQWFETYTR